MIINNNNNYFILVTTFQDTELVKIYDSKRLPVKYFIDNIESFSGLEFQFDVIYNDSFSIKFDVEYKPDTENEGGKIYLNTVYADRFDDAGGLEDLELVSYLLDEDFRLHRADREGRVSSVDFSFPVYAYPRRGFFVLNDCLNADELKTFKELLIKNKFK